MKPDSIVPSAHGDGHRSGSIDPSVEHYLDTSGHALSTIAELSVSGAPGARTISIAFIWMKNAREYRLPLSGRAMKILDAARKLGDADTPVVLVNKRGRSLIRKRLGRLLLSRGFSAVPHGLQSSSPPHGGLRGEGQNSPARHHETRSAGLQTAHETRSAGLRTAHEQRML